MFTSRLSCLCGQADAAMTLAYDDGIIAGSQSSRKPCRMSREISAARVLANETVGAEQRMTQFKKALQLQ